MKIRRQWFVLAVLLCIVTAAAIVLPTSLAYIAAHSNTLHNTFRVEYLPPADILVPVSVHKTVLCMGDEEISPGGFSFRLMNLNTGEITAMTTFTDGWATVELPFTAEDVGQTYQFRLYELDTDRPFVTFDETIYDISISLVLNEVHEMSAELTMNGAPVTDIVAEFVNLYEPVEIPDTGDHQQPLLWLALLGISGTALALLIRKTMLLTGGRSGF